jgi:3'-phosphoadenosine 5'-phosphosulfate sulfotransferase (PAPS reductase)/FAD synthetase
MILLASILSSAFRNRFEIDYSAAHIVSVSGGKDSTALLLLAIEAGVEIHAVFADTGHEHPVTYAYVQYLQDKLGVPIRTVRADFTRRLASKRKTVEVKWREEGVSEERVQSALSVLKPTGNVFLDMSIAHGRFPSTMTRFCTDELKVNPITFDVTLPLLKQKRKVWSWLGVRADESPSRSKLPFTQWDDPGVLVYRPLLRWTADDVFAMHRKHGIAPNPLYKQGMGRVGCMPCISTNKNELREIAARYPEELDRVRNWESIVTKAAKQGAATFLPTAAYTRGIDTKDVDVLTHGIDRAVEWSRTLRGGKVQDPEALKEVPMCSSKYGLCE